ncbi:MAG: hypothetical protein HYU99_04970 [Deltaproteobacteria bacterium]|nr:hypothetical protein [Deltaproteobacteria bacterium]
MERGLREEIIDFFRIRGERCLRISELPTHQKGMTDFNCLIVTPAGRKESTFIRLQTTDYPQKTAHPGCVL